MFLAAEESWAQHYNKKNTPDAETSSNHTSKSECAKGVFLNGETRDSTESRSLE